MIALRILPDGGRRGAHQVWPDPEPITSGLIEEAREHLFELEAEGAQDADLFVDDQPLEALRTRDPRTARWRWSPGFHAGSVECRLSLAGRQHVFEVITDPAERKLTRDAFDTMVREILDDTFKLFALSPFRKGVARGAGAPPPPIARLEFLRSRMNSLVSIVEAISRNPRRVLRAQEEPIAFHRASGATGAEILKSFRSGRVLREEDGARLPSGLQGSLPAVILRRTRHSSLDLREHREMKACLQVWSRWLGAAAASLRGSTDPDPERSGTQRIWARRMRRLAARLDGLLALPLFEGVGEAPPRPSLSPLWRGDPRYRAFLSLYRDISLGIAGVFGDFLQLPLARTFDLYELWAYLRLLRAAVSRHGEEAALDGLFSHTGGGITLAAGSVSVPLPALGVTLSFQRRYREYWLERDGRGSFSRDMQPDIVVEGGGDGSPSRLIVLDAKYRIGADLNDALSSAHMYRDALVSPAEDGGVRSVVTAAYLICPAAPATEAPWRQTPMPARLFHPEYRDTFRFGAMTLRPGMSLDEVGGALDLILADALGAPA